MYKYTIYTENKNKKQVVNLLNANKLIEGFTIYGRLGFWAGAQEKQLTIVILSNTLLDNTIKQLCYNIKVNNKQIAVLFTKENMEGDLI